MTPAPPAPEAPPPAGLTSEEAHRRLAQVGPNTIPDASLRPLRRALGEFWAPVPWMLEAAMALELVLGKSVEAGIILVLLVFNAALGFFQEGRAQATLAALKSRLALNASVLRDGAWATVPAARTGARRQVKLSVGAVVAADVRLAAGEVLLDQSMLTGESHADRGRAGRADLRRGAGAAGRGGRGGHGDGPRTKFGRTAELVRTAHVESTQQKAVLRVVRNLALFNGCLIALMVGLRPCRSSCRPGRSSRWCSRRVLASIPVALPATFTLAAALGARALARLGVLPTRLSAVDEAASIDVLCADKTGTLTRNELKVTAVRPLPGLDEATSWGWPRSPAPKAARIPSTRPFAPPPRRAIASELPKLVHVYSLRLRHQEVRGRRRWIRSGAPVRIVKGAFAAVVGLTQPSPEAPRRSRASWKPRASACWPSPRAPRAR